MALEHFKCVAMQKNDKMKALDCYTEYQLPPLFKLFIAKYQLQVSYTCNTITEHPFYPICRTLDSSGSNYTDPTAPINFLAHPNEKFSKK